MNEEPNLLQIDVDEVPDRLEGPAFERHDSEQNLLDLKQAEERRIKNKKFLLEWITEADFTKEISLVSLGDHPF